MKSNMNEEWWKDEGAKESGMRATRLLPQRSQALDHREKIGLR
jgi:hypothetical protein